MSERGTNKALELLRIFVRLASRKGKAKQSKSNLACFGFVVEKDGYGQPAPILNNTSRQVPAWYLDNFH